MHALRSILALAGATVAGWRRDRGFVHAAAVLILAPGLAHLVSHASMDATGRLVMHFGWLAAGLCGWLLAIGYGSGLADRGGVCGPLAFAGPAPVGAIVLGRYLGLAAGLALLSGFAIALLLLVLGAGYGVRPAPIAGAGWLLFLRLAVVLALAMLLGSVFRHAPAALLSTAAATAGWLTGGLEGSAPGAFASASAAGRLLLPRLPLLAPPLGGLPDDATEVARALVAPTLYALLYAGALLVIASLLAGPVLRRRGFRS